jgi:hypothetical protein
VEYLKTKWRHIDIDVERFIAMADEIGANRSWMVIPTDQPYGDANTMFRAELGVSYDEAMEMMARLKTMVGGEV